MPPHPFDAAACRQEMESSLTGSAEIDALTSQMSVDDSQSILTFGAEAAARVAQCSDEILRGTTSRQVSSCEPFLTSLSRVMSQFDPEEIAGLDENQTKKGGLSGLFGPRKKNPDEILEKYRAMGKEIEQVYIALRKYEAQVSAFQQKLQTMLQTNVDCYRDLVKYILAGEQGLHELEDYSAQFRAQIDRNPNDGTLPMQYDAVQGAYRMLSQRIQTLRVTEIVALQAIPMLQTMIQSNDALILKINTAFLVTLPVFRNALAQLIQRKRHRLERQAMESLEARIQARQPKSDPSDSDTQSKQMEEAWRTIVDGIEETRSIQTDAQTAQDAGRLQLDSLRREMQAQASPS